MNKSFSIKNLNLILDQVYKWSSDQKYRGHNKHDALNSPFLKALLGWSKWARIIATQGIMRFPINLRPLLFVPHSYNPKGLSLFIRGLLLRYRTHKDSTYLDEAEILIEENQ